MILLVAGTRPEIIKLAPVWQNCLERGLDVEWMWTGQHQEMAEETFKVFDIEPEHPLDMNRATSGLDELYQRLTIGITHALPLLRPEIVVVQGDTMSAAVATQVAFLSKIMTAHVEAGLRSFDLQNPFPEEACRIWIDSVADIQFAPTQRAAVNLSGDVYVTGNTVIDATRMVRTMKMWEGRYAVVTTHRRENIDKIPEICSAMKQLLADKVVDRIIWPVHPNPDVQRQVTRHMGRIKKCQLVQPLPYDQMINLIRNAKLVITDSGGLQEESLALSVPCLVMRETTERPEGVAAGGAELVGSDEKKIYGWARWLMENEDEWEAMASAPNPYGDGKAGRRIARVLERKTKGKSVNMNEVTWGAA